MTLDEIKTIGIDESGSLWLKPATISFPHIYRSAMEVHWDSVRRVLFSPKPIEWTYPRWFQQILKAAASEYGVTLALTPATVWVNIDAELQRQITNHP